MKKIFSLFLALLTVLCLTTAVFATETVYVTDQLGRLEESQRTELEETAKGLKDTYGIGVFMAYVTGHADDFAYETILGGETDYVLLLLGERGTRIYVGGKGAEIFSEAEDRDRLGYVHDEQDEWNEGVSRYLEVAEEYLKDDDAESEPAPEISEVPEKSLPEESSTQTPVQEKPFPYLYLGISVAALVVAVLLLIFARKKKA